MPYNSKCEFHNVNSIGHFTTDYCTVCIRNSSNQLYTIKKFMNNKNLYKSNKKEILKSLKSIIECGFYDHYPGLLV